MCAGIRAGVEVWALIGRVSCALLLLHEAASDAWCYPVMCWDLQELT